VASTFRRYAPSEAAGGDLTKPYRLATPNFENSLAGEVMARDRMLRSDQRPKVTVRRNGEPTTYFFQPG
jgi:hypothetical protein